MIHWDLIDERCYRIVSRTVETLNAVGATYTLGGGWAVYAYSPRTPSVDTDLYLDPEMQKLVREPLVREGFNVGQHEEIDFLELNELAGFWAHGDEDLGIQTPGFIVKDILDGRTRTSNLELPKGRLEVVVPNPEALLLFKLCALHNRDLCYRSYHDGVAMMHVGHQRLPQLWTQSQSYYHRKASKDLYDCGELVRMNNVGLPFIELIDPLRLEDVIKSIPDSLDPAVREGAHDLAAYIDSGDPFERLVEFLRHID